MILILQVCPDQGSGAERMLEYFLRALPKDRVAEIGLLSPPRSPLYALAQEVGARVFPLETTRESIRQIWPAAAKAAEKFSKNKPKLIHAWTARALDGAFPLGRRLGIPVAATLHDHPRAVFFGRGRRALLRWQAKRLDRLVFVSEALQREAERHWGEADGWRVIHNGLPELPPPPPVEAIRDIGFIGMGIDWKGFPIVAKAVERTPRALTWHFFGKPVPAFEPTVEAMRGKLGKRVYFHGHTPADSIFKRIDLLVHASTRFDPYPTVFLEAARAGVPVVASPLGGGPEIIGDGEWGRVCVPEPQAIADAVLDIAYEVDAAMLSAEARAAFVARHQAPRMVDDYFSLWSEFL